MNLNEKEIAKTLNQVPSHSTILRSLRSLQDVELTNQPSHSTIVRSLQDLESTYQFSIIVPVFNEESKISIVLNQIKDIFAEYVQNYEVVVINDGSLDETLKVILEEQRLDPHIKILTYPNNKGKGYAVSLGVTNSKGDIVVFLDGDFNISPTEIREYIIQLEGYDLAIASKAHPLSVVSGPAERVFLSKAFNLLVRLLVGVKIYDTQSGLKVGRGPALRNIFEKIAVKGFAFDVELLAIATKLDLKIKELPIRVTIDSSFNTKEIVKMFIDVMRISYRARLTRHYQQT